MEYMKKDIPYETRFWQKNLNNQKVLEDRNDMSSTALLD